VPLISTPLLGEPYEPAADPKAAVPEIRGEHAELACVVVEAVDPDASGETSVQPCHRDLTRPHECADLIRGRPGAAGPQAFFRRRVDLIDQRGQRRDGGLVAGRGRRQRSDLRLCRDERPPVVFGVSVLMVPRGA
jgi:hypothetical protein